MPHASLHASANGGGLTHDDACGLRASAPVRRSVMLNTAGMCVSRAGGNDVTPAGYAQMTSLLCTLVSSTRPTPQPLLLAPRAFSKRGRACCFVNIATKISSIRVVISCKPDSTVDHLPPKVVNSRAASLAMPALLRRIWHPPSYFSLRGQAHPTHLRCWVLYFLLRQAAVWWSPSRAATICAPSRAPQRPAPPCPLLSHKALLPHSHRLPFRSLNMHRSTAAEHAVRAPDLTSVRHDMRQAVVRTLCGDAPGPCKQEPPDESASRDIDLTLRNVTCLLLSRPRLSWTTRQYSAAMGHCCAHHATRGD